MAVPSISFLLYMASPATASAPQKITLGLLVGWMLGVLFMLTAITMLISKPIAGLSLLAASLILLPPVIELIQKKGNFHLSGGVKFILVSVLFGVTLATIAEPEAAGRQNANGTTSASIEAQDAAPKSYQEVFTFKGNGAKKSEPFTIVGEQFKIVYDCKGYLCQAWLKQPDNQFNIDLIMNTTGSVKDENIFYKSGTYYIESNSLGSYTMSVQDYK